MAVKIREANAGDVPRLVELRLELFAAVDASPTGNPEGLREATVEFFSRSEGNGNLRTWVADDDGTIVASGSIVEFIRPPYPGNVTGREAYILNMFTTATHRRRGIGALIMKAIMQHVSKCNYGKACLHASSDGRHLYESFGFVANLTAMEWTPNGSNSDCSNSR